MTADLQLVRVTDEERLRVLGASMRNCLASYGRGRLDGADRIYEVRRAGAVVYAVHVRDGRIVQFEAPRNRRPDPADVPVVRRLVEASGALTATAAEAADRRRRDDERALVHRRGAPARRATTTRRTRPRRATPPAPRPPRPQRPTWVSAQTLAAELLDPRTRGAEWPEVAAALWVLGAIARLPDPAEHAWERVVIDLAAAAVTGDLPLATGRGPSDAERGAAAERLRAAADRRTREGFQRLAMAELLLADVRP